MPFSANTAIRVCVALELPVTAPAYVEFVKGQLDNAYLYGGEAIVIEIEKLLDNYDQANLELSNGSANAGLIRADVLEWASGQRNAGYQAEISRVKSSLARILGLEELMKGNSNRVRILRG